MTFNSWEFLLFYPVVLLLYFLLPKRARWIMLLIASYFFYICYQASLVILILATTFVSWGASMLMERTSRVALRRLYLTVTLVVCLGVLFFFKYFNFLADSVVGLVQLFGGHATPLTLHLMLPVGISFYTFQTLSYVIDVYRTQVKPERNFFFYALYVSYFPQLVAGPIERPDNLIPQLKEDHVWDRDNAVAGAKFMLLGFFKKVVVADMLSAPVTAVYGNVSESGALGVILATVLFAVQIYCDFSGYTDIAIGCARIMGIRLMKNFNHPYLATSIRDFWGRWHISLSSWLRDYLYFPLGGSRCALPRHLMNLMIVFLLSGLWHGAAWTFVLWGALHGMYQVVGVLTRPARDRMLARMGLSPASCPVLWGRRIVTFVLVCFSWIFFRADSVGDLGVLLTRLFTGWGVSLTDTMQMMGLDLVKSACVVCCVVLLVLCDRLITYEGGDDGSALTVRRGAWVYLTFCILFAWVLLLSRGEGSTFIYFQF